MRTLYHGRADEPLYKLPWPFSNLQAFKIHYMETESANSEIRNVKTFRRMDGAIDLLVRGLDAEAIVRISPGLHELTGPRR